MEFWQMSQEAGELGSVTADGELLKAASLCSNTPSALRKVFHSTNAQMVDMQVAKGGATTVEQGSQSIPDFLVLVSTPIFSDRAASLAIDLGCTPEEFLPCRFLTNPDERHFFHLPIKSYDVVDYENSSFLMTLPGNPPVPMFIQVMKAKQVSDVIPPCFRASIPGSDQVLVELFASDDLKTVWDQKGFSGATFRLMSS
jgi:hypothetical protein